MGKDSPSVPGLEISQRLAIGGMAELFLARRLEDDRQVVVKTLLPNAEAAYRELFSREAEILALIQSPNVVKFEGAGEGYMVLEYVPGADLAGLFSHLKRRGKRLSLKSVAYLMERLCRGVEAIHSARDADGTPLELVHRDINPSNVLVSVDAEIKLADLGVVHVPSRGTTGGVKGTLTAMAPEQLVAGGVDQRTDVYALGLIAYEALTGAAALPGGMLGLGELLNARTSLPSPPSSLTPGLTEAVDRAVLWALEPEPDRRPKDVSSWMEQLQAALPLSGDGDELRDLAGSATSPTRRPAQTLASSSGITGKAKGSGILVPVVTLALILAGGFAVYDSMFAEESGSLPPPLQKGDSAGGEVGADAAVSAVVDVSQGLAELQMSDTSAASETEASSSVPDADPQDEVLKDEPASKKPSSPRITISQAGAGQVYVKGPGVKGTDARKSKPLGEGAHTFRLFGGKTPLKPVLRFVRKGEKLSVQIPKPADSFFDVKCGGYPRRAAPTGAMKVGRSLTCQIFSPDGDKMAFKITKHPK